MWTASSRRCGGRAAGCGRCRPPASPPSRQAWAETVAPVAARLREAEHLERRLSDLVDAAYGLTPDEVALMWDTAPPRMPFPATDGHAPPDCPCRRCRVTN